MRNVLGGVILIVVGLGFLGGTILMLISGHFKFGTNYEVFRTSRPAAYWTWTGIVAYAGFTGVMQGVREFRKSSKC